MKAIIIIVSLCVAGAFAKMIDVVRTDNLEKLRGICMSETGVDKDAVVERFKSGNIQFDDKLNCFTACVLDKLGVMKPDLTIDEQVARSNAPELGVPHEKVDQFINTCKGEVGKDKCETGGKWMACILKAKAEYVSQSKSS